MKSKIYTMKEKNILMCNPFVLDIKYDRFIEYDPVFKLWTIYKKRNNPEETCRQIFQEAGFRTDIMNPKLPQSRIRSWESLYDRYGPEYFLNDLEYARLKDEVANFIDDERKDIVKFSLLKKIYNEVKEFIINEKRSSHSN